MQFWRTAEVYLNRALSTAGYIGRKIPDVIVKLRKGWAIIVEVVSHSQTVRDMEAKIAFIMEDNPGVEMTKYICKWAKVIWQLLHRR